MKENDHLDRIAWSRSDVARVLGIAPRATYGLSDLPKPFTLKANPSPSCKKFWRRSDIERWLEDKSNNVGNKQ